MDLIADLALVLLAALGGGFLAQRIGQPLIVGYILAGVIVGPFSGGPTVGNVHDIERMAELGVVLLLFSLGLEVSFSELAPVRRVALIGGVIQVLTTIALGLAIGLGLGWDWRPAVWFGAIISLSSTMVALKTIQAQGRLGTLSSRVMLGILVVQDLAVVPLMIVLPELSDPAGGLAKVGVAAVRAALLLGVIVLFSTKVVPRLMAVVARWNSRELFFLSTITLAVGVGYVAYLFGLSMAIGAFVAGLVVAESEYAHQALSDVAPLRDLFGMLFFVSVGMLLDPARLWEQLGVISLVVAAIVVGKGLILAGVVRAFGYWNVIPLAVGMTLFQVGEFAFVLARVGLSSGALSADVYNLAMNAAIVTMVLTPVISGQVPNLYERLWPRKSRETFEATNIPETGLRDHVVICGLGRVGPQHRRRAAAPEAVVRGRGIRRPARPAGAPRRRADHLRRRQPAGGARGRRTGPGPRHPDHRAGVFRRAQHRHRRARAAPRHPDHRPRRRHRRGARPLRAGHPGGHVAGVRGGDRDDAPGADALQRAGARRALVASAIRHERYSQAGESPLALMSQIGEIARQLDFTWVAVPHASPLDGQTLASLRLRATTGVSVVGIIRDGKLIANPDGESRLERGDLVAVLGTRAQIARFDELRRPVAV